MRKSVAEYAQEAGISVRRVRKLAEDGKIDAEKVGNSWIIQEPSSLLPRDQNEGGRPLSAGSAWELALMLDGYAPISHRPARTRARIEQLRIDPSHGRALSAWLSSWLSSRAKAEYFKAQPADLQDLRNDQRLRATGVSHQESGLLQAPEFDAYVDQSDFSRVVEDYMLLPSSPRQANVILRVADLPVAPRAVPRLLVAVDLIDRQGPRELAAAQEILRKTL